MAERLMKYIRFFTLIAIAAGILVVLFSRVEIQEVYGVFDKSDKVMLIALMGILVIVHFFNALRWRVMLKVVECEVSVRTATRLFFANMPLAKIVPFYGGEFLRTYYLKDKLSITRHAGVIFAGMALDFLVLAALSLLGGLMLGIKFIYLFGLFTSSALIVSFVLLAILKQRLPLKLRGRVDNFLYIFRLTAKQPRTLAEITALTLAGWFLIFLYIKLTFSVLSASVGLLSIFAFQPVVILISLLPITIWGIGTRETVMIFLFSGLAQEPVIFAVGLTYSFMGGVLLPILFLPLAYKIWRELKH